jgi:hypothetical protein
VSTSSLVGREQTIGELAGLLTAPGVRLRLPHRSLSGAAPLKPLPEPVDPGLYRIRRQAQAGGLSSECRLVA